VNIVLTCGQAPTDVPISAIANQIFIRLANAQRWMITMRNTGLTGITAVTYAQSIGGVEYGFESASIGALGAGGSPLDLQGIGEVMDVLRLSFAIKGSTTVRISFGGV
jgi:hypothetical protein